ncbi:MAG: chromosome partitioning protein ParB [Chitinophagales bacterium]|nr:MAG: chromosome partitioning protein ParB [Chitinophagales bacterium]
MTKNKKEDFGKGIKALLDHIEDEFEITTTPQQGRRKPGVDSSAYIPLAAIEVNPFQPRADFKEESLQELVDSIKVHGVIQPITVRMLENGRYQLISGERRLRASKMAGLKEIPAFIREANDQEMLELALIENIQREDLNAVEIAITYKRLLDECNLTQEALASRLGKNRATITNYLRLLKLPPDIQKAIKERQLDMGHARAIISVEDPVLQLLIFKETINKGLSVRQVETLVRKYNQPKLKKSSQPNRALPLAYQRIQDELSSRLSTRVQVKKNKGESGEIIIHFYSDDDLERILEAMSG